MADIYLHEVSEEDLRMFDQSVIRQYLFEQGIIPPKNTISQRRNELLRSYIKRIADDERSTTAGYELWFTKGNGAAEALDDLFLRLRKRNIPFWLIPAAVSSSHNIGELTRLVIPRENMQDFVGIIEKLHPVMSEKQVY